MGQIQAVPACDIRRGDFVQLAGDEWRIVLNVRTNGDGRVYIFVPGRGEIPKSLGCDPDEIVQIKPRKE